MAKIAVDDRVCGKDFDGTVERFESLLGLAFFELSDSLVVKDDSLSLILGLGIYSSCEYKNRSDNSRKKVQHNHSLFFVLLILRRGSPGAGIAPAR
jgi:hypothetical protein